MVRKRDMEGSSVPPARWMQLATSLVGKIAGTALGQLLWKLVEAWWKDLI